MRKRKWPLLYQLIRDTLPFIVMRHWPRRAGVEPHTSMLRGKPVQSLFLVLSRPQQKMSEEDSVAAWVTPLSPLTSDLCTAYLVC